MDKSKIPTEKITLTDGSILEVYRFMTQDEEMQRLSILVGDKEFDANADTSSFKVSISKLAEINKFKVTVQCFGLSWEDFNVMTPEKREEILTKVDEITAKKKE